MALQLQNYTLQNGLKSDVAYIVIEYFEGTQEMIKLDVKAYISKEAKENGMSPLDQNFVTFKPNLSKDSPNYHQQGYEYLKTMPNYKNAINIE